MKTLLAALALLAVASTSQAAFDYYLVSQRTDMHGNNFCTYSNGGTYAMGMSMCPITIRL